MTGSKPKETSRHSSEYESEAFQREVLIELIKLHLEVLRRMPLVQVLLTFGIVYLVYRSENMLVLLAWSLLAVVAECLRAVYAYFVKQRGLLNRRPYAVHRRLIVLAAVVGAFVGLSAVLFMDSIEIAERALLAIILFAMPAAGVSVAVSSRSILAAYSLFILVPTAFAWILLYPQQTLPVLGLTLLYWIFIISVASDGFQLLRRSVAIRRERDRAIQDLEQINAMERRAALKSAHLAQSRARVLATASHDLRQPLHALSVYSAVLAANPTPETLPEVARNIDRLVRSLGVLLHGLLDLSRLSSAYYAPECHRISLDKLVEGVINDYRSVAEQKSLRLCLNLEHVRLFDDPIAISRITRNLIDNAIKYTDRGEVRVYTAKTNGSASLTIEDTGKGIPFSEQDRVFDEFYQIDNPDRDHFSKGVGLGLAIVQKLADIIKANIDLTSEPGLGSRFTVTFHTVAVESGSYGNSGEFNTERLCGKRIYVVDDEIDILNGMRGLLSAWEAEVKTAESFEDAEALLRHSGQPDLLIVDLRLRGEELGTDLACRLHHTYGYFPVLIVTGETALEPLAKAGETGFQILKKPITADILYNAVCQALFIT